MKNWQKILFIIIAIAGLILNICEGINTNFAKGYYNIIGFALIFILAVSKFTKNPL